MSIKYIILFILTANAFSQDYCDLSVNPAKKKVMLPGAPSWFISANPDGQSVGVILNGRNNIISMNEVDSHGDPKIITVPGSVDPVITPDSWFLTTPEGGFYDAETLPEKLTDGTSARDLKPLGETSVSNYYQSVGVLESNSSTSAKYMYIADPDSVRGNNLEYSIMSAKRDPVTKKKSIKEIEHGTICDGVIGHTPMISADGHYLSIINDKTMTTQILKIDKNDRSKCKMVVDLGMPTGKVSFNMNSSPRKIAFHVDRHDTTIDWFENISGTMSKDTFVMDMKINKEGSKDESWDISSIQKLSDNTKKRTGLYYPRFTKDGDIIAIRNDGENYYLEQFDLTNGDDIKFDKDLFQPFEVDSASCSKSEFNKFSSVYGLASIYNTICEKNNESLRAKDAALIVTAMDGDKCRELVNEYFKTEKGNINTDKLHFDDNRKTKEFSKITKEDALSACPDTKFKRKRINTVVTNSRQAKDSPENSFRRSCTGCHLAGDPMGGYAFLDEYGDINTTSNSVRGLDKSSAWKGLNSLLNDDSIVEMPPNNHLMKKEDLLKTVEFLKSKLDDDGQKEAVDRLLKQKIDRDY